MSFCDLSCLKVFNMLVGVVLLLASVGGIGLSLFMLFGDPLQDFTQGTYQVNFENIGPLFICSVISLLANVMLIGGAKQYAKNIIMFWIVWKILLVVIFWSWFGYSQLKHHGYIDWRSQGMRECLWCSSRYGSSFGFGGVCGSAVVVFSMIPVLVMHHKLKRQHRELTEYELAPVVYNPRNYKY